jgi:hypothetical protein
MDLANVSKCQFEKRWPGPVCDSGLDAQPFEVNRSRLRRTRQPPDRKSARYIGQESGVAVRAAVR